jgi:hypothetical protein
VTDFDIRQARPDDADAIVALYEQTQQWLWSKGLDQWRSPDGDNDALLKRVRRRFEQSINQGECYLALAAGELTGVIVVDQVADPNSGNPRTNRRPRCTSTE